MKLHLLSLPKMPGNNEELAELKPIGRNVERYSQMLREVEEIALLAEEYGFTAFGTTEHHFHTEGREALPSPLLLYVKIAQQTKDLIFMPTSLVMPARDPLRTAEDVALFDQMFPGRLKFSVARGYQKRWIQTLMQDDNAFSSFKPEEKEADQRNREIFNEYLDVMIRAWTEEAFNYKGDHYEVPFPASGIGGWAGWELTRDFGAEGEVDEDGVLHKIGVIPAPATKPHPEMFVPFSGSPQTLIDTAKRGFGVLLLESKPDKFLEQCRKYKQTMEEAGRPVGLGEKVAAVRLITLGDSFEEAMDVATRTSGWDFYDYFAKFGFAELFRNEEDDPNEFVKFRDARHCAERMFEAGHLICGTTDEVNEQISELQKCYADGELEWLSWEFYQQGNISLDEQKRQMKMFADDVWPNFRD
ncbi:MAG TPA: LLM class flavin-dependent oxidoreductase [Solirubrobacterales bacterium]|nr:LLM class flavin-dependent oxidoreductase [Solirubrobacterales bacterium]